MYPNGSRFYRDMQIHRNLHIAEASMCSLLIQAAERNPDSIQDCSMFRIRMLPPPLHSQRDK